MPNSKINIVTKKIYMANINGFSVKNFFMPNNSIMRLLIVQNT